MPSLAAIVLSRSTIAACGMRRKSNRCVREVIVAGSRCGSVVTRMNTACGGGSSSVFSSAFAASAVSMWASSMMYTLDRPSTGTSLTFSRRSRISSMPRLLAASISITSNDTPPPMARQAAQTLHGVAVGPRSQFRALARIRAVVVFPVPRCPLNR